jgi:hypothetical protein
LPLARAFAGALRLRLGTALFFRGFAAAIPCPLWVQQISRRFEPSHRRSRCRGRGGFLRAGFGSRALASGGGLLR